MIYTDVSFSSTDKRLHSLYEAARDTLFDSVKSFGDRELLADSPNSDTLTLNFGITAALTLADYKPSVAMDCIRAFLVTARADGRPASSLTAKPGGVLPSYNTLTGLGFAQEAVRLCYLARHKMPTYAEQLYEMLEHFDGYLWKHHDLNANGCLEIFNATEAEEGADSGRFAPITMVLGGEARAVSPFPVETYDLMAEAFSIRRALADLSAMLGQTEQAEHWQKKAAAIADKLRSFLWLGGFHACFDRDYRGSVISTMFINNLYLLYFGIANEQMADAIVRRHILEPSEFWTPMPLPTIAANSALFINDSRKPFGGQPRGTTYLRAITALERYNHYDTLTALGQKLMAATGKKNIFPTMFDPFTGEPSGDINECRYVPTAAAVLEIIKRFWGVYSNRETVCWGTFGHADSPTTRSTYSYTWGNDVYTVESEAETTTGSINGNRIFTVTAGTRVFTDPFGGKVRLVNASHQPLDCICICRERTYSFELAPNEQRELF